MNIHLKLVACAFATFLTQFMPLMYLSFQDGLAVSTCSRLHVNLFETAFPNIDDSCKLQVFSLNDG